MTHVPFRSGALSERSLLAAIPRRKLRQVSRSFFGSFRGRRSFATPTALPPKVIEIFGVSGAGKSTFLSQIRKQRPTPSFWATKDEFFQIRQKPRIADCRFDHETIGFLDGKLSQIAEYSTTNERLHRNYHNAFVHYFDFVFLSSIDLDCHVVKDEGFFSTFRKQILERSATDHEHLGQLARRHAFVAILSDPAQAVENLYARATSGGKVVAGHRSLSRAELLKMAELDARGIERLLALAKQAGVPVLEIATCSDATVNAARFEAMFG
jgi:hypothetical protein